MKKNVGRADAIIRVLIAILVAILIYTGALTGTLAIILGVIGGILLLTALLGFCGIYALFGVRTCSAKDKA